MDANRIEQRFRENVEQGVGALLPYFTAGFPNSEVTRRLIKVADRLGVTAVEIGFPYSDSIADGPVIQESFHKALAAGHRVEDALRIAEHVRSSVGCGLIAMLSYSIMYRMGLEKFLGKAAASGFDGLIVPDVPFEESARIRDAARRLGLCYIGLVAPTTRADRREEIARASTGFVYQMAVAGTTGERSELPGKLPEEVRALRAVSGLPVCVGFGISKREHVRAVCEVADGAIVGSAIVGRVARAVEEGRDDDAIVEMVEAQLGELMTGLRPVQ